MERIGISFDFCAAWILDTFSMICRLELFYRLRRFSPAAVPERVPGCAFPCSDRLTVVACSRFCRRKPWSGEPAVILFLKSAVAGRPATWVGCRHSVFYLFLLSPVSIYPMPIIANQSLCGYVPMALPKNEIVVECPYSISVIGNGR